MLYEILDNINASEFAEPEVKDLIVHLEDAFLNVILVYKLGIILHKKYFNIELKLTSVNMKHAFEVKYL